MDRASLPERLSRALRTDIALDMLPDTGLAHDHVRLVGTGRLARVPKQSQMQLAAADNLAYQAACFTRASASGHAPTLFEVLAPSDELPRGALIVEEIVGRQARLPEDLAAIATALARIHALPLPPEAERAPLLDAAAPLDALRAEVGEQAAYLDAADLSAEARAGIEAERAMLADADPAPAPRRLISFDAHPGNFLVRGDGSAVLVDLEKARYSLPPLDLAHATLYTSTTWDVATDAELSVEQVAGAYADWAVALGADAGSYRDWLLPLRRAMWLWSVTWCAKWRVLSAREAKAAADGEDWSAARSEDALIAHVRGRVDCYLDAATVALVRDEFGRLDALWR
ncbi:MAG: phosphotransferase [Alphaproteobacteria bacterium]